MKIPALSFCYAAETHQYGVTGFDAVDRWAVRHDATWRRLAENCEARGMSEVDRLKVLCCGLLLARRGKLEAP